MADELERALASGGGAGVAGAAEAATAGVVARAEPLGLVDVAYAMVDSPLGPLLAAGTPRGLVMLSYADEDVDALLARLAARVSPRILEHPARLDAVRRELDEYFARGRRAFDLPIDWSLVTGYARAVLRATIAIPYGGAASYGEVSAAAGNPRGARATGNALGSNPIPIVIPCHRVLRAGGAIGGYTGGLERKRFLLALEASSLSPAHPPRAG